MGESIVEGTLTRWLKKKGDAVERDEPLFEISTDKVDSEIPAPAAGVLSEILVEEGATVKINTVVARIAEAGADAAAPVAAPVAAAAEDPAVEVVEKVVAAPAAAAPVAAVATTAAPETVGPLSPLVRKMARENNLDLTQVRGTGAGGRITKSDVEGALSSKGAVVVAAPAVSPAAPAAPVARGEAPKARVEPMSVMRQKIAEHMVFSQRTSAFVTTVHKVDMTKVAKLRAKVKDAFQTQYGFGITYLSFITRAAADALRTFPILNASIDGTNVIYHGDINIGIAVALDGGNGLIVPVIRNADEKNVVGLQRSIVDLAARARSKQLKPDDVQGGTFSITNFGSFGSVFATPVINQPQVAILGAGTVEKVPVVIDDAIAIRSVMYLSLTFDHRLIDGALADQFCQRVKAVLEGWSEQVL
jgi:2-oxoglutarate dehydrogenase E2 component (dihydrolipoamide succinyltransferase)